MADRILIDTQLTPAIRETIAAAFWATPVSQVTPGLDHYFKQYYIRQCEVIALRDGGRYSCLLSHDEIVSLARSMKAGRAREEIADSLLPAIAAAGNDVPRDFSIELVARLLVMIEFGNLQYTFSSTRPPEWSAGTLQKMVESMFNAKPEIGHENLKLEKIFNAHNLGRLTGIEVVWTDNIADHLRLLKDDRAVAIFHHASFLKRQQADDSMLPQELVKETLTTIALLFPRWDEEASAWYSREAALYGLDPMLIEVGHLDADGRQFEHFRYWHDRLVFLKQVFDEARPQNLSQWWNDRRNGVQWYTFWVAMLVLLLTIFFGLIQSIEGAMQVYKVFNS